MREKARRNLAEEAIECLCSFLTIPGNFFHGTPRLLCQNFHKFHKRSYFLQNCINQFTATAQSDRCSFIGNVNIGKDVKIAEMLQVYDAVVMVSRVLMS